MRAASITVSSFAMQTAFAMLMKGNVVSSTDMIRQIMTITPLGRKEGTGPALYAVVIASFSYD